MLVAYANANTKHTGRARLHTLSVWGENIKAAAHSAQVRVTIELAFIFSHASDCWWTCWSLTQSEIPQPNEK